MKIKTSELTGAALDWLVAQCENADVKLRHTADGWVVISLEDTNGDDYSPTTNWSQGGPIIEHERIALAPFYGEWVAAPSVSELITDQDGDQMVIVMWRSEIHQYGVTPLIAAMRCFVASQLGDSVDIPSDLL